MMKKLRLLVLMTLLVAVSFNVSGQEVVWNAEGVGYSQDIREATEIAIREAKLNAVKKARVYEKIISEMIILTSNQDKKSVTYTNVVDLLMLEAMISYESDDLKCTFSLNDQNWIEAKAQIRKAKVWEMERDPYFTFTVKGIELIYMDNDKMSFQVKPQQECYIRIFFFDLTDEKSEMVFPHREFNDLKVDEGETFFFPPKNSKYCKTGKYDFVLEKDKFGESWENLAMIVVAVKDEKRVPKEVTWNNVVEWIHSIPSDKRAFKVMQISIKKRD